MSAPRPAAGVAFPDVRALVLGGAGRLRGGSVRLDKSRAPVRGVPLVEHTVQALTGCGLGGVYLLHDEAAPPAAWLPSAHLVHGIPRPAADRSLARGVLLGLRSIAAHVGPAALARSRILIVPGDLALASAADFTALLRQALAIDADVVLSYITASRLRARLPDRRMAGGYFACRGEPLLVLAPVLIRGAPLVLLPAADAASSATDAAAVGFRYGPLDATAIARFARVAGRLRAARGYAWQVGHCMVDVAQFLLRGQAPWAALHRLPRILWPSTRRLDDLAALIALATGVTMGFAESRSAALAFDVDDATDLQWLDALSGARPLAAVRPRASRTTRAIQPPRPA